MKVKIKKLNPNAKMPKRGTKHAAGFDLYAADEATHPRPCQELLIMALKNGKPVFIPHAYFGLGDDHFYEAKTVRGNTVAKRVAHKVAGYDDVAWAYLDVPSWWHAKEKDE